MGAVFCPAEADEEQCRPPGASGLQLELTHRQNGLLSSVVPHGGTGLSWVQAQLMSPVCVAHPFDFAQGRLCRCAPRVGKSDVIAQRRILLSYLSFHDVIVIKMGDLECIHCGKSLEGGCNCPFKPRKTVNVWVEFSQR